MVSFQLVHCVYRIEMGGLRAFRNKPLQSFNQSPHTRNAFARDDAPRGQLRGRGNWENHVTSFSPTGFPFLHCSTWPR